MAIGLSGLFLNPAGLLSALFIIPFLLLYLIKPKPHHETIPSLLFIMKDRGRSNINNLFRTFLKDILLLFQLILLLLIIGAVARPYIKVPRKYLVKETVLLVDTSASMQAHGDARFKDAIKIAKENLGKENTIILIEQNPDILVEKVSSRRAEEALNRLKPTDTATDLTSALQLANGYANPGTRIVVISDFIPSAGDHDYNTVADALEGTGALVEYHPVTSSSKNVGIVDLAVGEVTSKVWIKNSNTRPKQVTLKISDAKQQVLLGPSETKEITFKTPPGITKLSILEKDDLAVDNNAWISTPEKNTIKVLIITNDEKNVKNSNFLLALNIIAKNFPIRFDISYAEPPKIPNMDYDVYIVDQANLDLILPGYVKKIEEVVEKGGAMIIFQQPSLFSLDWRNLLPVVALNDGTGGRASVVPEEVLGLTKDIEFGQVSSYMKVKSIDGATVIAKAVDPLIVMKKSGKGTVLYYGIDDNRGSFSRDPSYPVFWRRVFDLLTDRPSLENLNLKTGGILSLHKETTVKTPEGTIKSSLIQLKRAGIYTLPDRSLAVNLLSSGESSITTPQNLTRSETNKEGGGVEKAPKEVTDTLLWVAILMLILELLYMKYRGDL